MKSDIQTQIARIDQNLKLLIYSQHVRQKLHRRKAFLNHVLTVPCYEVGQEVRNFVYKR
jgi:hypothetical protein